MRPCPWRERLPQGRRGSPGARWACRKESRGCEYRWGCRRRGAPRGRWACSLDCCSLACRPSTPMECPGGNRRRCRAWRGCCCTSRKVCTRRGCLLPPRRRRSCLECLLASRQACHRRSPLATPAGAPGWRWPGSTRSRAWACACCRAWASGPLAWAWPCRASGWPTPSGGPCRRATVSSRRGTGPSPLGALRGRCPSARG
mmetsp:Transcript_32006/g.61585  ORF Transcript_32006/g.61585 Transcript_32006/m.61585 type:complete len:201 (+) Transcript_32006:117-719(+)